LFQKLGYVFLNQQATADSRSSFADVILTPILKEQLNKINSFEFSGKQYKFSAKNIDQAVADLDIPLNEGLSATNQKITNKLLLGESYEEVIDGEKTNKQIYYIDFENPHNNLLQVSEEFTVLRQNTCEQIKHRRPDLVLFINGIPVVVIELKKSSVFVMEGIKQICNNQQADEIPQLFKYVQITLAANNAEQQYATATTPAKFYSAWKENSEDSNNALKSLISDRVISELDHTIYNLFNPVRLLELIKSFVLFDKKLKKIARYQQYFAVKAVLKRVQISKQGGLIWHTQGSGKSLTMVMLTKILKQSIANARIIVVTDRTELNKQIHDTFFDTDIKVHRATSGHDLISKLKSGASVITTLIHKFDLVKNQNVIMSEDNIFILVDESHRTQGGDLHKAMKKVFPKGCYLGFTGTPLLAKQKHDGTLAKFGGMIHKYTIEQAVADKAVVPLLYQNRPVVQEVKDKQGMDRKFAMIARNLLPKQQEDLKRKYARFSQICSSLSRLEVIAMDIMLHFNKTFKQHGSATPLFKAMLATNSKFEAVRYQEIFEQFSNIKSAVVISAVDVREGKQEENSDDSKAKISKFWNKIMQIHHTEAEYIKNTLDDFKNGDLELLIVVDKLLTGFDAPQVGVLYIDKELKDHNLLQAIARANRLADGKDYGLIIDYRGLFKNLESALSSYEALAGFDEEDIKSAIIDITKELPKLQQAYENLEDHFQEVQYKHDQESYEQYLADQDHRHDFYNLLSAFGRFLRLILCVDIHEEKLSQQQIDTYKQKMKFYAELRQSVKKRYQEIIDFAEYEQEMRQLLDTYISANDVMNNNFLINIFSDAEVFQKDDKSTEEAKADILLCAMIKEIKENREKNPVFYDSLSVKIDQILQDYKSGLLDAQNKLQSAYKVREDLCKHKWQQDQKYPKAILEKGGFAKSLYDNLQDDMKFLSVDQFESIIINIDDIFKDAAVKPGWKNNIDVKNSIDQKIDDMFFTIEKELSIKVDSHQITKLLQTILSLGIKNH